MARFLADVRAVDARPHSVLARTARRKDDFESPAPTIGEDRQAALPVSRMFAAAADSLADPLPTAQRQPFMRAWNMMIVHKNSLTRAREFVKTKTLNIWGELHRKNLASSFAWRE